MFEKISINLKGISVSTYEGIPAAVFEGLPGITFEEAFGGMKL